MDGERPVRPRGARKLGLVDSVWNMTLSCWQHDPAHRPTTARVVGFLREWSAIPLVRRVNVLIFFCSYTLLAAGSPLSASAWQQTRNVDDAANQGSISPNSSRTSQHSGQSQTHETSSSLYSTFNINYPDIFLNSHGPSREPLSDESRTPFYSGNSNSNHLSSVIHTMFPVVHAHNGLGALRNVGILDQSLQRGDGMLDISFPFFARSAYNPLSQC